MKSALTILAITLSIIFALIPHGELFKHFMPRSVCMFHEDGLIAIHGISDGIIFIAYSVISISLISLYKVVINKNIPLKAFMWWFAIFIMLCGLTHLIGVVNLFVTFYWLDGAIKVLCAVFSIIVAINFLPAASIIKGMKTKEEYDLLKEQFQNVENLVEEQQRQINKILGDINNKQ